MNLKKLKAHFDFETAKGEKIKIKFAISAVSTEGALKNLQAEIPKFDFENSRAEAKNKWQNELGKIRIDAAPDKKTTFYTSLYHTLINPVQYMDVDGKYRGPDHNIHEADGFVNYCHTEWKAVKQQLFHTQGYCQWRRNHLRNEQSPE